MITKSAPVIPHELQALVIQDGEKVPRRCKYTSRNMVRCDHTPVFVGAFQVKFCQRHTDQYTRNFFAERDRRLQRIQIHSCLQDSRDIEWMEFASQAYDIVAQSHAERELKRAEFLKRPAIQNSWYGSISPMLLMQSSPSKASDLEQSSSSSTSAPNEDHSSSSSTSSSASKNVVDDEGQSSSSSSSSTFAPKNVVEDQPSSSSSSSSSSSDEDQPSSSSLPLQKRGHDEISSTPNDQGKEGTATKRFHSMSPQCLDHLDQVPEKPGEFDEFDLNNID